MTNTAKGDPVNDASVSACDRSGTGENGVDFTTNDTTDTKGK
jgi:hypothetical protein